MARQALLRLPVIHLTTGRTAGAATLVALMVAGSVVLWVGVPVGWLWVASIVQGATGSLGAALLTAFAGVAVSIGAIVLALSWLALRHRTVVIAGGGRDPGIAPLEIVMVTSAAIAVTVAAVWFFGFSGAAPLPVPR